MPPSCHKCWKTSRRHSEPRLRKTMTLEYDNLQAWGEAWTIWKMSFVQLSRKIWARRPSLLSLLRSNYWELICNIALIISKSGWSLTMWTLHFRLLPEPVTLNMSHLVLYVSWELGISLSIPSWPQLNNALLQAIVSSSNALNLHPVSTRLSWN